MFSWIVLNSLTVYIIILYVAYSVVKAAVNRDTDSQKPDDYFPIWLIIFINLYAFVRCFIVKRLSDKFEEEAEFRQQLL